ncbi:hypothetical protein IJ384_04975 [bacterium]|nr:hypothetical protein [bacterium]
MDIKKILFKTNDIDMEKALPDATVYCNKDGKILWVNDKSAEIFETSKMHLLTSNIADFIENVQNLITSALISEHQVITKLIGKEIYFDMTAKEISDGYVMAFRDCINFAASQIKPSEEDIERENRNKNMFLLKLANDLKSPLQSIVGFSQAMSDGLGGEMTEQQDKYIKIIKKNSSDLMYFVNKLLELSQSEVEMNSPDLKIFDIVSCVNSIVKFNEQLYKGKDLKWNIQLEDGLKKTIVSDENIVKNIIQNTLEVVLKSVDMGEIVVSLSVPDEDFIKSKNLFGANFILISISSSSLLLSENDLESMFDPYKIVDTSNRKNLLRALTLACVKNSVQLLNGMVWVESKILKNTSFNILIPQGAN